MIERIALAMAGKGSPWGKPSGNNGDNSGGNGDGGKGDGSPTPTPSGEDGPRNPWLPGGKDGSRGSASIEDLFKNRGPEGPRRTGGGPRGPNFRLPERPGGKSWWPIAIGALALVWIGTTSVHFVQPREAGIKTWFGGQYAGPMQPGTNWSWPWPIQMVEVENVSQIRLETIGGGDENLILTGDQNLVDLSYIIRWNIKDLSQFKFQLAEPAETVREVAEAAMRASVAETDLDTVLSGSGREQVEFRVRTRMQTILDGYGAGVAIQGIEIDKTEAPQQVIEAFNDVLAARQDAERNLNEARRYEQQLLAQAQGGAAEFNEIYAQYRLAPQVTRQRLYYETMESVLAETDKTIIEDGAGVTPYLPLPEVRRRSQEAQGNNVTITPSQSQQEGQ
ncbi:protease modulator HflK [Aurantiacibacter flavus]|uniref:Protease modulator HflK n=1 Tax=Aurantiacibacter flavus TaxID=3145232 RepID=A0ABV0D0W1_9SPHN